MSKRRSYKRRGIRSPIKRTREIFAYGEQLAKLGVLSEKRALELLEEIGKCHDGGYR